MPAPPMISPLLTYEHIAALRRDAARDVITLIASTLQEQIPGAAYLTFGQDGDLWWLEAVLAADGRRLHTIGHPWPARLPSLPAGSPHHSAWQVADADPTSPQQLLFRIIQLLDDGMEPELLPADLHHGPDRRGIPCILLAPDARPDDELPLDAKRLLRPHTAPTSDLAGPESPITELLRRAHPDQVRTAAEAGRTTPPAAPERKRIRHFHISEECIHGEVKRRLCDHTPRNGNWRVREVPCAETSCRDGRPQPDAHP
ncbi:hypothetical protein ACIP93_34985 [Streptomyces sp. NPDC088745]|uniref:hypothetical protein n=1 Tax=Streptomyces sp. NPDC088745 TaxID=3365884 RepID=UPI003812D68B